VLAVLATRRSATVSAVGLATAAMAANAVAVVSTVVFARLLGTDGYGALAALLNLSVILFVPGLALQVAAAREGALGRLGAGGELAATVARWRTAVLVATVVVACAAVLARGPLAALLNVDEEWAAAAVPVTGCLWLLLCLQRGLLQATRAYRAAGLSIVLEATGRLATGVLLAAVGLGVTGAYLGTAASITVAALVLDRVLRRRLGPPVPDARPHPLGALARDAAMPIAVLTLLASLQNVDVIMPWLERTFGFQMWDSDVYYFTSVPSDVQWPMVAWIAFAALVLTALATIYPALRASRTEPAEALRYE